MANEKILVSKIEINEKTDIFLPIKINIPRKAKKILGFVFTTSIYGGEDNPIVGTVKVASEVFGKADVPDFDVFQNEQIKWNKHFLPIVLPLEKTNETLTVYYKPYSNPVSEEYTLRVYVKYLEEKENGC